jgi:hypothetical protein
VHALWEYYLSVFTVHRQSPLLTGDDIMDACPAAAGPRVGELLRLTEEARADGIISTREDALKYLRRHIQG